MVAQVNGCAACHTSDGSVSLGPTWMGLYGSEVTLRGGLIVIADEAYLRESIVDPTARVVLGIWPVGMPEGFGDTLSEREIASLIAYIKSLADPIAA